MRSFSPLIVIAYNRLAIARLEFINCQSFWFLNGTFPNAERSELS